MKIAFRIAVVVVMLMLKGNEVRLYGGVGGCVKFATGTDSCSDGPFWNCAFPTCGTFHIAGAGNGASWDNWSLKEPEESGYWAPNIEALVCSVSGNCIVVAEDPLDPEDYICTSEDPDNWTQNSKIRAVPDINTPCY